MKGVAVNVSAFASNDQALQHYMGVVDVRAEQARLRYITPGTGQAITYEQKYREALAGDGPLLQAEAEALGKKVSEVAQEVLAAHAAWQVVGSQIEALRLKAKADIRAADTVSEMYATVSALKYPS